MLIPTKTVKCYPNDNPWLTAHPKRAIKTKNRAFATGHRAEGRASQVALKREIAQAKGRNKECVETMFQTGNLRQAWQGLSVLTGKAPTKRTAERREGEEAAFVTNLNCVYCRFDNQDFSPATEGLRNELQREIKEGRSQPITLTEEEVRQGLRTLNPSKAPGSDLIKGRVVKECADELASILCHLFSRSLQENTTSTLWKHSEIRPVPKTTHPAD